jgi:hypothetical protein
MAPVIACHGLSAELANARAFAPRVTLTAHVSPCNGLIVFFLESSKFIVLVGAGVKIAVEQRVVTQFQLVISYRVVRSIASTPLAQCPTGKSEHETWQTNLNEKADSVFPWWMGGL